VPVGPWLVDPQAELNATSAAKTQAISLIIRLQYGAWS